MPLLDPERRCYPTSSDCCSTVIVWVEDGGFACHRATPSRASSRPHQLTAKPRASFRCSLDEEVGTCSTLGSAERSQVKYHKSPSSNICAFRAKSRVATPFVVWGVDERGVGSVRRAWRGASGVDLAQARAAVRDGVVGEGWTFGRIGGTTRRRHSIRCCSPRNLSRHRLPAAAADSSRAVRRSASLAAQPARKSWARWSITIGRCTSPMRAASLVVRFRGNMMRAMRGASTTSTTDPARLGDFRTRLLCRVRAPA